MTKTTPTYLRLKLAPRPVKPASRLINGQTDLVPKWGFLHIPAKRFNIGSLVDSWWLSVMPLPGRSWGFLPIPPKRDSWASGGQVIESVSLEILSPSPESGFFFRCHSCPTSTTARRSQHFWIRSLLAGDLSDPQIMGFPPLPHLLYSLVNSFIGHLAFDHARGRRRILDRSVFRV